MTDRRPHWDDDLVDAVIDLQYHCVDCMEDDYPDIDQRDPDAANKAWAHAIIAAVEDWQIAKAGPGKYAITLGVIGGKYLPEWIAQSAIDRATKAESKIQRVRELHHPIPGFNGSLWCSAHCEATADGDPTHYPCATIRALDGEK